jgi:hypothetical protein
MFKILGDVRMKSIKSTVMIFAFIVVTFFSAVTVNYAAITTSSEDAKNSLTVIVEKPLLGHLNYPMNLSEVHDEDGEFSYLGGARGIFVHGNYAYIASWGDHSITIMDITDPTNPVLKSEVFDGDGEFSKLRHAVSIDVQ